MFKHFLEFLTKTIKQSIYFQKLLQLMIFAVFITFSSFLVINNPALAVGCHGSDNVQFGDVVFLQEESDSKYITQAYKGNRYYYLTTDRGESNASRHKIEGNSGDVKVGSIIELKILDTRNWDEDSKSHDLVGAFANKKDLYYWEDYGDKTKWIIERPEISSDQGPIQYGESIYLRNKSYSDEYLTSTLRGYATTEATPNSWKFCLVD